MNNENIQNCENNPDLSRFVKDFIPLSPSEYSLEFVNGTRKSWQCQVLCKLTSSEDVREFVDKYLSINNETLKKNNDKKCGEKSPYLMNRFYRCHHDTRYEKTRLSNLSSLKPNKRFKNTHCPFNMSVKIFKDYQSLIYPCVIYIEHDHNHPVNALQSLSFKSIADSVASSVRQLFERNMTPSMAYYEYLQRLRQEAENELEFHIKKADRSICPRRRDFNSLYKIYCQEEFGGKNGETMFVELEKKIQEYKETHPECSLKYNLIDQATSEPLIIAIITPLMSRIHAEVYLYGFVIFGLHCFITFPKILVITSKKIKKLKSKFKNIHF